MKLTAALNLLFFIVQIGNAQFVDTSLIHHTFNSNDFKEDRKITVHLPRRYLENPSESMMVTYVPDAQGPTYFNMLIANLDYLTSRYSIIPTIVVGIHSKNRFKEFTPFARPGNQNEREAKCESKLSNLYDHLEKEIFPWVEANFRTVPFKAIIGHSRGGSFVVQSLFDGHKNLFDAYLAISPGLAFDDYQVIDLVDKALSSGEKFNKFFYISTGDDGETEIYFDHHVQKKDSVLTKYNDQFKQYHRYAFPEKDHVSTILPSLNQGLVLLKNAHMAS